MSARVEEVHRLEEELARRRVEIEQAALAQEEALRLAGQGVENARTVFATNPRVSFQSTLVRWVRGNPNGKKLRDLLPASLGEAAIVDILARWPDSQGELVRLIEHKGEESDAVPDREREVDQGE